MLNLFPKVTIDLGAVRRNYLNIANKLGHKSICSAVLKNDAYGLGAKNISQVLYSAGCRDFWVAYITEALNLRQTLPLDANVYFLQGFDEAYIPELREYKLTPVINSIEEFYSINNSGIEIVLHFDTGLTRLGLRFSDIDLILQNPGISPIKYVISHLACSDEVNNPHNYSQKCEFDEILKKARKFHPNVKAGISSSFGIFINNDYAYDILRVGAYLYGIGTELQRPENVLSMSSVVLQKYKVPAGTKVGYGATYTTDSEKTVAVISIGYADGIKKSLANKGKILFYDKSGEQFHAKILGAISMDLLVCDVSNIPDELTEPHEIAYILDNRYTINEMASDASTIAYEILTSIKCESKRINVTYL